MTDLDSLFPDLVPDPGPPPDTRSAGQRQRDRMANAIRSGQHPLSVALDRTIRLHPDAQRQLITTDGPRCGTCQLRGLVAGGNRAFPKCHAADTGRHRITHGSGTDVRASWPACTDHHPKDTR